MAVPCLVAPQAHAVNNTFVEVVYTGYCLPSRARGDCTRPQQVQTTTQQLLSTGLPSLPADERERVNFADVSTACGGSSESWSPSSTHYDAIHVNARGYCLVFTQLAVQRTFGCPVDDPIDMDCASLEPATVLPPESIPQPRCAGGPVRRAVLSLRSSAPCSAHASGRGTRAAIGHRRRSWCASSSRGNGLVRNALNM